MVVCKCRKATRLYCFVHKVPVCGECVCSSEHQICVVRTYSEWVIDGDYDWPPKCHICNEILQSGEAGVTRLGCLHALHTACLLKHLQAFPSHTAPAGYTCPICSAPVWPPKSVKDYSCALASKLKEVISQSGLSKTLLGNDLAQQAATPPAFVSAPLSQLGSESTGFENSSDVSFPVSGPQSNGSGTSQLTKLDAGETTNSGVGRDVNNSVDSTNGIHPSLTTPGAKLTSPLSINPGAMTRKNSLRTEKVGLNHIEIDSEDDDGGRRKYNRRGPLQNQALKYMLPFWSNALPTLPVTTPARKDDNSFSIAEEIIEGRPRRRSRSSAVNTKKVLLVVAIMSCMATMILLYYRLLQGNLAENFGQFNKRATEG